MKEIAIASQLKNKNIVENLYHILNKKLNFCNPILTSYSDNNFSFLLIAINEKFFIEVEEIVKNVIIDYIENIYKVEYLKNKIKVPIKDSLAFNAYIKVLAVFDRSTDESVLKKNLMLNQTFFIDSFLEFRLTPLKKHWDNLSELSSDNLTIFNSSTFVDVIRFLINTMENETYKLKVVSGYGRYSLYKMPTKNAAVKKLTECETALELISEIFNFCPNYIDFYVNSNQNDDVVTFLSEIFSNRLKIFSKI